MEKNEVNKNGLSLDEEKKLLRKFQIPDGEYRVMEYGSDRITAFDPESLLLYRSVAREGQNGKKYIDVQIDGLAHIKGPHKIEIRYDVTDGIENAKKTVEKLSIFDGTEELCFKRYVAGSDSTAKDHDSARIYYIIHGEDKSDTCLAIIFDDRYCRSDIYQSMCVSIPSEYVHPAESFVLPDRTVDRLGSNKWKPVVLETNTKYVLNDNVIRIEGVAFESLDADFYRNMNRAGLDRNILENEGLSEASAVISYGGISDVDGVFLNHELKIVRSSTDIAITYKVMKGDNITINDLYRIPCSSAFNITGREIDSIIDILQKGYPDETFISAAIIELEEFKKEVGRQAVPYPQMMEGLATMNLRNFNFDYILDNKDRLFAAAREQYSETWFNSLVEKEAMK